MNALSVIIRAAASRLAVLARKRALGPPVAALSPALALAVVAGILMKTPHFAY